MATFIPIQLSHAALLAACITLVYIYTRRRLALARLAAQHHCQPIPRLPSIDPLLNLDILFSALRSIARHTLLRDQSLLFQRHGQTLALRELHHRIVFTTEPENIKTVLSLRFSDYGVGFRLPAFAPLLGAGIFDTDGEHWSASRALVRPAFTREQVADLTAFEELFQDLVNVLPQDGGTVDLQALFFKYTMDSATEFLFGQSAGTLRTEEGGKFARAFQDAQRAIIARGTLGWMSVFYWDRRAEQGNRVCREFAGRFVDEAFRAVREKKREVEMQEEKTQDGEGEKKQKYIFAHELASRTEDRQRVVDESMNVLLAGRDTTASLLSNLFFMLAKNPDIWTKLRREVSSLEGRPPTYEELRSLDYVQCCLHECKPHQSTPTHHALIETNVGQPSAYTPSSRATNASPSATPSCPSAAAPPGIPRSSSARAPSSPTRSTPCTAGRTFTAPTPRSSGRSGGATRGCGRDGATCRSTAGRGCAWASGTR